MWVIEKTDHPHVRGEKATIAENKNIRIGSSPRAWGKGPGWIHAYEHPRIIPTCVGKSLWPKAHEAHPPDHPHVRGEKG